MKTRMSFAIVLFSALFVLLLHYDAAAQTANLEAKEPNFATLSSASSSVRWEVKTPYGGATLTVSAPDGRVFRYDLKAGALPEFATVDKEGNRLPDGNYTYELRLMSAVSKQTRESLLAARGKDDDAESLRSTRKRGALPEPAPVQSGDFSILNGTIFVPGAVEEERSRPTPISSLPPRPNQITQAAITKLRQHHLAARLIPDDVIPDDLIVQGSACVGLDCVNGEVFGFDTIRLKENNDRLQFDDTSSTAGFATNNWQIRANSSASGGASFLAFVDQGASGNSETGTIVFEVDAGAPANSLKVSSTGRVGLRTATPVLDVHIATGDTPAHRLEQTNASGFTAQTWDVAGNEANFFVRDVTGGSRLPFRIRPGAPTSSIDISALGNVGIGVANAGAKVQVNAGASALTLAGLAGAHLGMFGSSANFNGTWYQGTTTSDMFFGRGASTDDLIISTANQSQTELVRFKQNGRVGIGTNAPDQTLTVNGEASKPGGGSWAVFSDERLKTIKGRFNSGLKAVMQLQPLRYEYKRNNALDIKSEGEHIGFGAQALQRIIPEAVDQNSNGYLQVNNDPILWTMLNAIQEQQKQIEQLQGEVRKLRAASRRRR